MGNLDTHLIGMSKSTKRQTENLKYDELGNPTPISHRHFHKCILLNGGEKLSWSVAETKSAF